MSVNHPSADVELLLLWKLSLISNRLLEIHCSDKCQLIYCHLWCCLTMLVLRSCYRKDLFPLHAHKLLDDFSYGFIMLPSNQSSYLVWKPTCAQAHSFSDDPKTRLSQKWCFLSTENRNKQTSTTTPTPILKTTLLCNEMDFPKNCFLSLMATNNKNETSS